MLGLAPAIAIVRVVALGVCTSEGLRWRIDWTKLAAHLVLQTKERAVTTGLTDSGESSMDTMSRACETAAWVGWPRMGVMHSTGNAPVLPSYAPYSHPSSTFFVCDNTITASFGKDRKFSSSIW